MLSRRLKEEGVRGARVYYCLSVFTHALAPSITFSMTPYFVFPNMDEQPKLPSLVCRLLERSANADKEMVAKCVPTLSPDPTEGLRLRVSPLNLFPQKLNARLRLCVRSFFFFFFSFSTHLYPHRRIATIEGKPHKAKLMRHGRTIK